MTVKEWLEALNNDKVAEEPELKPRNPKTEAVRLTPELLKECIKRMNKILGKNLPTQGVKYE